MAQPVEDSVEVYEHLQVPPDQLRKATLAASVGFIARPIGGLFFEVMGDRLGASGC